MSTRPYATHGGLRIRQSYNKAAIRYREWAMMRRPTGATGNEWLLWVEWVRDREAQLLANRDKLVAAAEGKARSKKHGSERATSRYQPYGAQPNAS